MEIAVKIKIKDVTIELTLDEAKQLAEELGNITGEREIHHHYDGWWRGYRWWEPVYCGTTSVSVEYLGNKEIIS